LQRSSHPARPALDLIKIGDFARLAGTNLRTLRYYEELGLLVPSWRSGGGFRFYRREDIHRLEMIRELQGLGLHLDRIRELLPARDGNPDRRVNMARVRKALSVQDRLLSERIKALLARRRELRRSRSKLAECERCQHSPRLENNYCEPCQVTGLALPCPISALF
jgi:DNA-binding transcriptional MerR regulator